MYKLILRVPMSTQQSAVTGYISSVGPNDVILGRGNHNQNTGNERFHSRVRCRSVEYWSCNDNVTKDNIARQIIDSVTSQGGRFLRKVTQTPMGIDSGDAAASGGIFVPSDRWEIADTDIILIKVKQTFRDFTASNKKRTGASKSPTCPIQGSSHGVQLLKPTSILERLENYGSLFSPPLTTPPGTTITSRTIVPQTTSPTDEQEMMFRNTRTVQLEHLIQNVQQQLNENNNQDQQLVSLFEQQRAILFSQLQDSTPVDSQPTQSSQHQLSNDQVDTRQRHQMLQAAQRPFHQGILGLQSSTAECISHSLSNNYLSHQLSNRQSSEFHQDHLSRDHSLPQQQPQIQQQLRMIPQLHSATMNQPQYPNINQNVQHRHQRLLGLQSSTAEYIAQPLSNIYSSHQLSNQQSSEFHQDHLSRGHNVSQQQLQIQQQSRMMPQLHSANINQPQYPNITQNVQHHQMVSMNPMLSNTGIPNWSLEPTSYNHNAIPEVTQPAQQYTSAPHQLFTNISNQIVDDRGIAVLSRVPVTTNLTNVSYSGNDNELNSISHLIRLPQRDMMIAAPFSPFHATTDSIVYHREDSPNDDDDKKPPAV